MNARELSLSLTEALIRSQKPSSEESEQPSAGGNPPLTITISREVGAGGQEVAAAAGKRVNWPVYDQEIINKIAEEMGKPSSHVRGVDEKYFTWLEEVMANLLSDYHVNSTVYLKNLVATIRGLGAVGKCVIVGRAGSFILPPESTLRVRLMGEMRDRVLAIGRRLGISNKDATNWIEKTERERIQFVRQNFGKEASDPHHYDLVLNTSVLDPEDCAEVIAAAVRCLQGRSRRTRRVEELVAVK